MCVDASAFLFKCPILAYGFLLCLKILSGKNWDSASTSEKEDCPRFGYVSWALCAASLGIGVHIKHLCTTSAPLCDSPEGDAPLPSRCTAGCNTHA